MKVTQRKQLFVAGGLAVWSGLWSAASGAANMESIVVEGRQINLVGEAVSASQGVVGQQEIRLRPLLRSGEVLEMVPGMVVTQHSGTGKANQYFLRGFNLDHGTDFATFIDGMPINMRSHGHGQGYTDLNVLIPEAVDTLAYKKGAYYADVGDFSGAGSAAIRTLRRVDQGLVEFSVGEDSYNRAVVVDSVAAGGGDLLYALEYNSYDGPWSDIDEDLDRKNLLLTYSAPLAGGEMSVSLMGYDNQWNSADQIPARAVASGLIDELGSLDTTLGGESSRYSLSGSWENEAWSVSAYAADYDLDLWSNFTYLLDNPQQGDQFQQVDDRRIYGGSGEYRGASTLAGLALAHRMGLQVRYDDIDEVGLYRSRARNRLGVVRSDGVAELSSGLYWESQVALTEQLRAIVGLRYDYYDFDVDSRVGVNVNGVDVTANSGTASDDLFSAKTSLIYTVSDALELYASLGQGMHSNDARGTTIVVDPADGSAIDPVDPLVRSLGYEVGVRGYVRERLNASVAFWALDLDSELLFVGDAGNTEASRESERRGVEATVYYNLTDQWTLDMEYAWTDAEFADSAPEGREIPGAIEHVLQAGVSAELDSGYFGSLRLRYFGERPLVEDGSVTSDASTVVNLRLGRRLGNWTIKGDLLNVLDSDDHDIDYYYASRLPGEPAAGVEDLHYHVLEPRTLRVSVGYRF